MPPERVERKLAAILAADVAGYSWPMGVGGRRHCCGLKAQRREQIYPKIAEHQGRVAKITGYGILIEFPSLMDAMRCSIEMKRGTIERNARASGRPTRRARVGINVGDIERPT